jgi:hypothetical protein
MFQCCLRLLRRRPVALLAGGVLLAALTATVAPMPAAWADTGAVFAPVAWKSYPTSDSVEMGDHALNLNFNFGSPNNTVSSAAHNLKNGTTGTPSGYTVLLRTSSDGVTQKLPPTPTSLTRLSSVRVGLTPTSTIVQGAHASLRLDAQATKPYLPSASIGELNSRISNSPFMYLRMQVTNTSTSTKPASAVYVGFGSACGPVMDDYPVAGWRTLRLCNAGDRGGVRYLSAPKTGGSSWGIGSETVADFAADGTLGGGGSSGKAAVALPVPALAGGARHSVTLVYGAWNDQAGITSLSGSRYPFYYRSWHADPAAMLGFAIDNQAGAFDGSAAFDARVNAVSSDTSARFAAVHGFRGWRHANWLVSKPGGGPFYAVTEGAFNYLSTIDVGYEYHLLQTRFEPWKSKLELDQWATRYELDDAGRKFMLHDLGKDERLTVGPAYDQKVGHKHMPVEHNLDMVAMIFAWERRTGGSYDSALVRQLLDAAESHDSNQNGTIDVTSMHACVVGGSCGTRQLGTTYDGATSAASQVQAGNTILTTKFGVIESFAAARGYGYGAQAQRHLDAARSHAGDLSSDTSLAGHGYAPGYLPDALLYATVLGSNPTLTGALSAWLHGALVSNQQAALRGSSTAVTPNSSGETITWISKALDGDAVAAWIGRTWPAWSTTTPDAGKLWNVWNRRGGGGLQGTFDFVTFPGDSYFNAGWYPRAASLWGAVPSFP